MASSANNQKGTFQGPPNNHNKKSWAQAVSGGATKTSSISHRPTPMPDDGSGQPLSSAAQPVQNFDHFLNNLGRPFIKGSVPNSLLIDITNVEDSKKKLFLSEFQEFCDGQTHLWSVRDHFRRDYDRCYAEVVVSPSMYHKFLSKSFFSLVSFTEPFIIYPSLSPSDDILKISLTGLPDQYGRLHGGMEQLTADMSTNLTAFGTLLDCGFVTGASGVYSGNGYAVLSVNSTSVSKNTLSHKINWSYLPLDYSKTSNEFLSTSDAVSVLATWAQMPPYCRYCHASEHSLKDCQWRLKSIVCNLCHETGHIRKDCGRRNNSNTDQTKKRKTSKKSKVAIEIQPPTGTLPTPTSSPTAVTPSNPTSVVASTDIDSSNNTRSAIAIEDTVDPAAHSTSEPSDSTKTSIMHTDNSNSTETINTSTRLRSRFDTQNTIPPTEVDMTMDNDNSDSVPTTEPELPTTSTSTVVTCKHCGLPGHQRTTSYKCLMNPKNINNQSLPSSGDPMEL